VYSTRQLLGYCIDHFEPFRLYFFTVNFVINCSCNRVCIFCAAVVGEDGATGESSILDTKALLSLLQKSDQPVPSLPSLYLDSRLAPHTTAAAAASQGRSTFLLPSYMSLGILLLLLCLRC